jgi:hypothetical protein
LLESGQSEGQDHDKEHGYAQQSQAGGQAQKQRGFFLRALRRACVFLRFSHVKRKMF